MAKVVDGLAFNSFLFYNFFEKETHKVKIQISVGKTTNEKQFPINQLGEELLKKKNSRTH